MSLKLIRRTALLTILLPCLYFGTASGTFLYRIHAENRALGSYRLAAFPAPSSAQRLVIFSPHPDDETLGCAGLIQQAARAGAPVTIAMLTNGDGFRVAVERQFRKLHVQPADYVRFADLRQQECTRALGTLGVPSRDVLFMGYPDRGLMPLWNDHWAADDLFTSPYTRRDTSPYAVAFHEGADYCGQSVLDDVKQVMLDAKPTDVYVTHPGDDHPDHSAASAFVTLALLQLRQEGLPWARSCRLHYYLVHRGDWPAPQGLYKNTPLVPPAEMAALDTAWRARPLGPDEVNRKVRSILAYNSQTAIMKRFLFSFARRNEIFGDIATARIPQVPNGSNLVDGSGEGWKRLPPEILDPVNDNLLRDFQAGGDIKAIYACRDASNLYVRVENYGPVARQINYQLRIRYFGDAARPEAGGDCVVTMRPPEASTPSDLQVASGGNCVEFAIPLRRLGYAHSLAMDVETRFAGLQVDRTGYRFVSL